LVGTALLTVFVTLVFAVVLALPGAATAAGGDILVVAPHPDDDILYGAGVAANGLARGDTVTVLFMTNGDKYDGVVGGLQRQDASVEAQVTYIGTTEPNLIFLGYPDGGLHSLLTTYSSPGSIYVTSFGQSTTYGDRGLGSADYHFYRFGEHAFYNGANVLADLDAVLSQFRPDDIYTTGPFDAHGDHHSTYQFVKAAVAARMAADGTYSPTLHSTIVHWGDDSGWPAPMDPQADMVEPPGLSQTGLSWSARESLVVPESMQVTDAFSNPKFMALYTHDASDALGYLGRFVHRDEIFWAESFGPTSNQAPTADAGTAQTVSEQSLVTLDGSGSSDPDGDTLTYAWTQTAGPTVTLSDAGAAQPTFTAPTAPAELTFELVVSDGSLSSSPDSVTISVTPAGSVDANIAPLASVTASSEDVGTDQLAVKAVDGSPDGWPGDYTREWATVGQRVGAWLRLTWTTPQAVSRIVLYDRPNTVDQITAATLQFSDGSTVTTGTLPNDGSPLTLDVAPRVTTSLTLTVTFVGAATYNVGLAEIEVWAHTSTD
jgi:LmbE family N-acetylglucosaminyl deacetylase